jgi:DNA polymerase-3 subunit delta
VFFEKELSLRIVLKNPAACCPRKRNLRRKGRKENLIQTMSLIKRSDLKTVLDEIRQQKKVQCYLFFGERFLCRESADLLEKALLDGNPGAVNPVDGDQEDAGRTLARLMSFSLLPGIQIFRVTDSRLFQSRETGGSLWDRAVQEFAANRPASALRYLTNLLGMAQVAEPFSALSAEQWQTLFGIAKPAGDLTWADALVREAGPRTAVKTGAADLGDRYIEAFTKGLPDRNLLILTAEAVDKRKRLFSYIKEHGVIIDCAVDTGSSSAAQKVQKDVLLEMIRKTLDGFNKKIEPRAMNLFLERVGFYPVAAVMEAEKLALSIGDRPVITYDDLEQMVGRNREDALFELTDSFGKRQTAKTLVILTHLLEDGTHGLAILATMRNYLRKLLIFRSFQLRMHPSWHRGMSVQEFQGTYLPALKETGEWADLLKGHPYALYMSFTKAAEFSCPTLKKWLGMLLEAEFRLKGSPLPQHIVLEELFLSMLQDPATAPGAQVAACRP